jgi:hypothetical protein
MVYIHPVFQLLMILAAAFALYLGSRRFRSLHLRQKTRFNRRLHARVGGTALAGLLVGMAAGSFMVDFRGLDPYMGKIHGPAAVVLAALAALGLVTGLFLYLKPRPGKALPLAHGAAMLLMLAVSLALIVSGVSILWTMIG